MAPIASKEASFFKSSAAAGEADKIAEAFPNLRGAPITIVAAFERRTAHEAPLYFFKVLSNVS